MTRFTLTDHAELLLFALCDPEAKDVETLFCELWADEILILLDLGYAELTGTILKATLQATAKGREAYAQISAKERAS
jgi:hypothetical protein